MKGINLLYLLLLVFGEIQNSLSCQTKPTGLDFQGSFSSEGLMHSSYLQTDEPNYFPELEF